MYIRKVTMWVKRDAVHTMTNIYSQGIIPALRERDGCLFAALLQNVKNHQMCSSITIWRSREKADSYERSGLYEKLLASLKHLFQDTSNVNAGIWEDLKLDYAPTPERPVVIGFEESDAPELHKPALPYFVHLLCLESRSDKVGEFRQHYFQNILSLISPQKGFIDAFLMHRLEQHHSFCMLSFWDGSIEPSKIIGAETVKAIRERSKDMLLPGTEDASVGGDQLIFRCLTADWFSSQNRKSPSV